MKRLIIAGGVVLSAVWLQAGFLGGWRPLGVVPNLFLIGMTYLALALPASEALTASLIGGFLLDLVSGADFGLRMAFYSFYVLVVVFARQSGISGDSLGTVAAMVGLGTLFYNLAVLSSLVLSRVPVAGATALKLIVIELVFNLALTTLTHRIWHKLLGHEGAFAHQ